MESERRWTRTVASVKRSRLMVIRRGDRALLERFRRRFTDGLHTVVIYDRRADPPPLAPSARRSTDRRYLENAEILARRGYFATRTGPGEL